MPWRQATALKALRTNLTYISPVLGLTHLLICEAGTDFEILSQTLALFKSLQTLYLESYAADEEVAFPTLHLAGLQELRSIHLNGLVPGSIRLSASCKLHFSTTGRPIPWGCPPCHALCQRCVVMWSCTLRYAVSFA